jgi:signal transduction histidine kinase
LFFRRPTLARSALPMEEIPPVSIAPPVRRSSHAPPPPGSVRPGDLRAPEPDEERDKRVYLEQVTLLYQQAFPAVFVNATVAALVVLTYWGHVPHRAIFAWVGLVGFATVVAATVVWLHHKATVTVDNARLWGRLRLIETAITGTAWGAIALLIFPHASPSLQPGVIVVLAGLASGCIPVNGARLEVYLAYVLPLCVPIALRLLFWETHLRLVGLTGAPFLVTVIVTAQRLAQRTESSLRLQFENWSLARELGYEIAERRRAEEKLQLKSTIDQLSDSLQQRNRELTIALTRAEEAAKVKSQFLANMSHELRTPLNAIINIPEGLQEDFVVQDVVRCGAWEALFEPEADDVIDARSACPSCSATGQLARDARRVYVGDPERTRKHLATIHQGGRHLLSLITDVLDFSKIEAGKAVLRVEPVELSRLLSDLRAALLPLAEPKRITLRMTGVAEGRVIEADPTKLVQIFTNLIGNAIKFSDEGSVVEMRVEVREGAGTVVMSVADQGIGIHPKDHDLVFEAFRQVDGGDTRRYGGSGLGLTITRDLVHLHGGTIRLESAPGVGSTFFVELPVTQAARESARQRSRA